MTIHRSVVLSAAALLAVSANADITLIGKYSIPGTATDLSKLGDATDAGSPLNRLGGFGSAIAYTGTGNHYVTAVDRGPGDGAIAFPCRLQFFEIVVKPGTDKPVDVRLERTTMLTTESGAPLIGAATAFDAADQSHGLRFDPEGVRVSRGGTLFVSDEYGPWIDEFSMDGKRLRRLEVPKTFGITTPSANPKEEDRNTSGRQANRGLEGLAISPDGATLFSFLQSPLIQDGAMDAQGKRVGMNIRVLAVPTATGPSRQYVYQLHAETDGVNEALSINGHELLVLERDGKAGTLTHHRALYKVDVSEATDVSGITALPKAGLPKGVQAMSKTLFLDFLDPKFALAGPDMPEKIEGMCFGPDLADGRHTLIVTTDNDLKPEAPSWFWVFAVDPSDVPGFAPQAFDPLPKR